MHISENRHESTLSYILLIRADSWGLNTYQ